MKMVFSQKIGTTCFVYALANCYAYLNYKLDKNFQHLFKDLCDDCKHGPLIEKQRAIKEMGLNKHLIETDHASDVKYGGGIIAIMHPIFNLHAVFVAPIDKNYCTIYNSWLGPAEMRVSWDEILRFTNHRACSHWYMRELPPSPSVKGEDDWKPNIDTTKTAGVDQMKFNPECHTGEQGKEGGV